MVNDSVVNRAQELADWCENTVKSSNLPPGSHHSCVPACRFCQDRLGTNIETRRSTVYWVYLESPGETLVTGSDVGRGVWAEPGPTPQRLSDGNYFFVVIEAGVPQGHAPCPRVDPNGQKGGYWVRCSTTYGSSRFCMMKRLIYQHRLRPTLEVGKRHDLPLI